MLEPKLSLKPTTAFELQNIGLFAISHPFLWFCATFFAQVQESSDKTGCTEFIVPMLWMYTVSCDMMQIQKYLCKMTKKMRKQTLWCN